MNRNLMAAGMWMGCIAVWLLIAGQSFAQEETAQPPAAGQPDAAAQPADAAQPAETATAPADAGTDADQAAIRKELTGLKEVYEKACAAGDPSLLKPHLDTNFSGVMVTSEAVHSFTDVQKYWEWVEKQLGKGGKYTVAVKVDENAIIDGDTALAHGTTQDHAVTSSGREFKFQGQWTAVCRRNPEGEWKILRIHGSINPLDNPFVAAMTTTTKVMWGAIAGVAGLLLGFVGARMMSGGPKSASPK